MNDQNLILQSNSASSSDATKEGSVGKHDFTAFLDKF